MKIGIIGGGVVGRATARAWLEHCEQVCIYDLLPQRRTHDLADTLNCDLVFVCLPTPGNHDGTLNCAAIDQFFGGIQSSRGHHGSDVNFVLKSTVPIGTTRRLAYEYGLPYLVHSPEFLTARCAVEDACNPAQLLVGLTGNGYNALPLRQAHAIRFPGVPVHIMSSNESELVKLAQNSLFALKIAALNELNSYANSQDMEWDNVLDGILGDGRVGRSHTQVPGPDGKYGFGGKCLPKDLSQLVHELGEAGMVFNAAQRRNIAVDRKRSH